MNKNDTKMSKNDSEMSKNDMLYKELTTSNNIRENYISLKKMI